MLNSYLLTVWDDDLLYVQLLVCIICYIYIYIYIYDTLSPVGFFVTPWTVAYQDPQPMGFSRQEYWSGLPFPSPRDLPEPGTEPGSPAL